MDANQGRVFRDLLKIKPYVYFPGIYDCIGAGMAANTGHDGAYMSGYSVAASLGFPDLGLVSGSQNIQRAREITSFLKRWPGVRNIPVIADADNGYGDFFNVMATTQDYIDTGVAGIHLEDQILPKSCGQIGGKRCVSIDEAANKIGAAIYTRNKRDPDFFIIARTDRVGASGGSLDQAIEASIAYLDAGADMVWPEFPGPEIDPIKLFAEKIGEARPGSLMGFNYSSNKEWHSADPKITWNMLGEMGYKYIFTTMVCLHAAGKAMYDTLEDYEKNAEKGQWNQEQDKSNHPTKSFQKMWGMVDRKMELAKKFGPEFTEALRTSAGFGSDNDPHADKVHGKTKK